MKNEELCRIQNELEQECDQFRKVKKMIQEHGLPNHEHLVMLQQQVLYVGKNFCRTKF